MVLMIFIYLSGYSYLSYLFILNKLATLISTETSCCSFPRKRERDCQVNKRKRDKEKNEENGRSKSLDNKIQTRLSLLAVFIGLLPSYFHSSYFFVLFYGFIWVYMCARMCVCVMYFHLPSFGFA